MKQSTRTVRDAASAAASEDASDHAADSSDLAAYIADLSSELAELAGRAHMQMVAYFLNLARVEAETFAGEKAANRNVQSRSSHK